MIHIVRGYRGSLAEYLRLYDYQPELTDRLDTWRDKHLSQANVNEIILWKLNRYAHVPDEVREEMYAVRTLRAGQHRKAESVLLNLMRCKGVDLPIASTLLRYQNPDVFQIIDKRAYRALFGAAYPLYSRSNPIRKVAVYFCYLEELRKLAATGRARYRDLDRILYVFDTERNGRMT